jgi:ABC-2 type transport system permease protein
LLRHELRLVLRESRISRAWIWALVGLGFLALAGAFFARQAIGGGELPAVLPPQVMAYIGAGAVLMFTILVSITVRGAVQALFERGDVDLLLSSPLDSRVVLASKGVWVMLGALGSVAFLVVPVTIGAAIFLGWRVLGVLPLTVALSMIGTGLGLVVTLALVRALGARRARTVAQVVGVLVGAGFYLLTQLGRFINADTVPWLTRVEAFFETIPADSPLLVPARAALLEPLPTLLMLLIGVAVFALSVQLTHRAFVTGATAALGGGRARLARNARPARFQRNFFVNVLFKEWRLIARDPLLISRTLLQLVYFVPLAFTFLGGSRDTLASLGFYPFLAFVAVFVGGSLSQNLTQIVIAAEDAPELLKMSPARSTTLRAAKLVAAIAPVWALFVPLILYRAALEPRSLLVLVAFAAVTVLSGLMMLWSARPFNRADLQKQRRDNQSWQLGLALLVFDAACLGALLLPGPWNLGALAVAVAIPLGAWLLNGRTANSRLGY